MIRTYVVACMVLVMSISTLVMGGTGDPLYDIDPIFNVQPVDSCFVENLGQWDLDADLVADVPFGHIALSEDSFVYDVIGKEEGSGNVLSYEFVNSNPVTPVGRDQIDGLKNFFYGSDPSNWVSGARSYRNAHYEKAWNGVDIEFQLGNDGAKYEFIVSPHTDPDVIRIRIDGHDSISTRDNDLWIGMEDGRYFVETGLKAFYLDEPESSIDVQFLVEGDTFGFHLDTYDESRTIVIDPLLMNSTFIGGSGGEGIGKTILGADGALYIVGDCGSSGFPTTPGAYDDSWNHYHDIIVMKMDLNMNNLLYATYIGGKDADVPTDIAYASDGEVVISGYSDSLNFPTTIGSYQPEKNITINRTFDLIVLRLNKTGGDLVYSTYLGWSNSETRPEMVLDEDEGAIMVASTSSNDIPMNDSSYDNSFNGGMTDMVFIRLNSDGSNISEISYIGGSANDSPTDIQKVGSDLIYIAGGTNSSDLPMDANSYNSTYNVTNHRGAIGAGFMMVYNMTSKDIQASTYIPDLITHAFSMDQDGNPAIAGFTYTKGMETSELAYQGRFGGGSDIYICKLDSDLTTLLNATYIGSSNNESLRLMAFNETGHLFLTGIGGSGFPITPGAYDSTGGAGGDIYLTVLSPYMSKIVYSSFIGGQRWEYPFSIITMPDGSAIVGGETSSNNFPTVPTNYDSAFGGVTDIFIFRMQGRKIYLPPDEPRNLTGGFISDNGVGLKWNVPEWDGDRPILGYNISRVSWDGETTVVGTTSDLSFIDDTVDVSRTYHYFVTAYNDAGDSTPSNEIKAMEFVPPVINEDLTKRSIGPGEDLLFSVNVTDNSRIMDVKVAFSIEGSPVMKVPLFNMGNNIYSYRLEMIDIEQKVDYRFIATDIKSNIVRSEWDVVIVAGDYLPLFLEDRTPEEVRPYQDMEFKVDVIDNWGVSTVQVEFWTGSGPQRTTRMDLDDITYVYDTRVVGYPGELIHYIFHATDTDGNQNSTEEMTIRISDAEPPYLESDLSTHLATTGEPFTFKVLAGDDDQVTSVKVRYRITGSEEIDIELEQEMGPIWRTDISIGHIQGELNYSFLFMDKVGNSARSQPVVKAIIDNDNPTMTNTSVPGVVNTGDDLDVSCVCKDNIGIQSVTFGYRIGFEPRKVLTLEGGPVFNGLVEIPSNITGSMSYTFTVTDIFGNTIRSDVGEITILDGQDPEIEDLEDITTYEGMEVSISVNTSDNIGVRDITWTGLPDDFTGSKWTGIMENAGEHSITLTVRDTSNLTASTSFNIFVLQMDHDGDGDGIPDLVEIEHGLDPEDPSDASKDMDKDGLTNIEEYDLGTWIDSADTDSDGMDDGWEHQYGLDPKVFSAFNDADGDLIVDLEEYLEGSDPTVFDKQDEPEEADETILMIVFFILLLVIALAIFWLIRKKE